MADLLCAAPRCAIPGRHADDCDQDTCRGCLAARAADGIMLCPVDLRRLGANAVKVATLHGELELVLKVTGNGDRSANRPGPGTPPRDAVVDMRATIRHTLVSWSLLVADERGITLPWRWTIQTLPDAFIGPPALTRQPDDTTAALGRYLTKHAEWLAAHQCAGEVADELAALASRAWGLAYPSGTRRVEVGPCPLCDGALTALVRATDNQLPSEVACDGDEAHRWPAARWRELDRLVTKGKRVTV